MNGELIRRTREAQGLSQIALARKAEIPQGFLSLIENGKRENVSIPTLKRLAAALGVPIADLLTDSTPAEALAG